jgi:hypothetical protein
VGADDELTLRELLDAVYAILLERLERRVMADRQAALLVAALGGRVSVPTFEQERQRFDEALCAQPQPVEPMDREQWELRQVLLGVA